MAVRQPTNIIVATITDHQNLKLIARGDTDDSAIFEVNYILPRDNRQLDFMIEQLKAARQRRLGSAKD